jgi:hypothetical protein
MRYQKTVTNALEHLTVGLTPFVETELQRVYGGGWLAAIQSSFRRMPALKSEDGSLRWDAHSLLTVMWDQWNQVFRTQMGFLERSMVSELREYRNRWAHQVDFSFEDAYRIVDNADRLLRASSRPSRTVENAKREMLHTEFSRQTSTANERTNRFRKTWMNIGLYSTSALGLGAVVMAAMPAPTNWILAAGLGIALVFVILSETRVRPRLIGPHECHWCHKIVYSEVCPYCQPELLLEQHGLVSAGPGETTEHLKDLASRRRERQLEEVSA